MRDGAQPGLLVALTLVVVGLAVRMTLAGTELTTAEAPQGIVSYEFAGSAERSRAILDSWSPAGREAAMFVQGLDALFLVAYAAWLSLASLRLSRRLGGVWPRLGVGVAWLVLLAAPFDAIENFSLVQQLVSGPAELHARVAWASAVAKFGLVAIAIVFLLAGSVAFATGLGRRR